MRLSTHIPSFAKAAAELAWWTQVTVDRSTARRITEAVGATVVAHQTAAAEQILREYPPAPPGPEQMVFSVDGAMVPLLHGQWAEARTLAVGRVTCTPTADGQSVSTTDDLSYFSRLTSSETFGTLATLELHRRGLERAGRVSAVVDGAEWCQTFIDLHAPQAVRILDFPHAAEYLTAIGQTTVAGSPILTAAEVGQLAHDLKHTGAAAVLPRLQTLVIAHPAEPGMAKQVAYLEKRVAQMQYPTFQAAGWPIGSGMVESANKLVVEERLKGPGMHWAEAHVNPLLALRNAMCSNRWDEVWMQIEIDQRQQRQQQRQERRQKRRRSAAAPTDRPAVQLAGASTPLAGRTGVRGPVAPSAATPVGPAPDHPWKKAWSIRRQRELAAIA